MKLVEWDNYFINIANSVKLRSSCDRLNVGCVLVKDQSVIATGYNGSISGHAHCNEVGHLHAEIGGGCKRTIHAEVNAILQCARKGVPTEGVTAYVTHYPCPDCMKLLNQAGVNRVVYEKYYPPRYKTNFNKGMEVVQLDDN